MAKKPLSSANDAPKPGKTGFRRAKRKLSLPSAYDVKTSKAGSLWIWGIHPVMELLRSQPGRIKKIVLFQETKSERLEILAEMARRAGCLLEVDPGFTQAGLERAVHQGVAALVHPVAPLSLEELLQKHAADEQEPFYLALDCLQDPHNLGAIIRSAAAAGVSGILLPKDRSVPVTATAYKVSAGTIFSVDLCQVTNLAGSLQTLKKEGIWVFGAEGSAPRTIYQQEFRLPLCLVIGGEGKGLRQLVRRCCDLLLSIPLSDKVESLNASTAAAITLFEVVRQRRAAVSVPQP
jgi:23S rRNA (guanosine2251-2'-O)-methyltransferase